MHFPGLSTSRGNFFYYPKAVLYKNIYIYIFTVLNFSSSYIILKKLIVFSKTVFCVMCDVQCMLWSVRHVMWRHHETPPIMRFPKKCIYIARSYDHQTILRTVLIKTVHSFARDLTSSKAIWYMDTLETCPDTPTTKYPLYQTLPDLYVYEIYIYIYNFQW